MDTQRFRTRALTIFVFALYGLIPVCAQESPRENRGARIKVTTEEVAELTSKKAEPVEVILSIDKTTYAVGDSPIVTVEPKQDCYLTLFYEDAEKNLIQLFPNKHLPDARVKGGEKTQLLPTKMPGSPDKSVGIEIYGPPFGIEHFVVFATDKDTGINAKVTPSATSPFAKATRSAGRINLLAGKKVSAAQNQHAKPRAQPQSKPNPSLTPKKSTSGVGIARLTILTKAP